MPHEKYFLLQKGTISGKNMMELRGKEGPKKELLKLTKFNIYVFG